MCPDKNTEMDGVFVTRESDILEPDRVLQLLLRLRESGICE